MDSIQAIDFPADNTYLEQPLAGNFWADSFKQDDGNNLIDWTVDKAGNSELPLDFADLIADTEPSNSEPPASVPQLTNAITQMDMPLLGDGSINLTALPEIDLSDVDLAFMDQFDGQDYLLDPALLDFDAMAGLQDHDIFEVNETAVLPTCELDAHQSQRQVSANKATDDSQTHLQQTDVSAGGLKINYGSGAIDLTLLNSPCAPATRHNSDDDVEYRGSRYRIHPQYGRAGERSTFPGFVVPAASMRSTQSPADSTAGTSNRYQSNARLQHTATGQSQSGSRPKARPATTTGSSNLSGEQGDLWFTTLPLAPLPEAQYHPSFNWYIPCGANEAGARFSSQIGYYHRLRTLLYTPFVGTSTGSRNVEPLQRIQSNSIQAAAPRKARARQAAQKTLLGPAKYLESIAKKRGRAESDDESWGRKRRA